MSRARPCARSHSRSRPPTLPRSHIRTRKRGSTYTSRLTPHAHAPLAQASNGSSALEDVDIADAYLRAGYWALVTMTTVGHVDIIDKESGRLTGAAWELGVAIGIALVRAHAVPNRQPDALLLGMPRCYVSPRLRDP